MRILDEKQCNCHNCNAKLAYTDDDIHINAGDNFIICPRCESRIFINCKDSSSQTYLCSNCHSDFNTPTYIGEYGILLAKCPYCGYEEMVGDGITLTIENVEYPTHFHSTENAVEVKNDEINKRIKQSLQMLNKDEDFSYVGGGDTVVLAYKADEDYHSAEIIVAKKYMESEVQIPKENF